MNRISSHQKNLDEMFSIAIDTDTRNDIENIADGIFSPLGRDSSVKLILRRSSVKED